LQQAGVQPDIITYNSLISAYSKGEQWERAMQVFKAIPMQGLTPDIPTYNPLLSVIWQCGQRAKANELFMEASEAGVYLRVTASSARSICTSCPRARRWHRSLGGWM